MNTKKKARDLIITSAYQYMMLILHWSWNFGVILYVRSDYFLLDIVQQIKWFYPEVQRDKLKSILPILRFG